MERLKDNNKNFKIGFSMSDDDLRKGIEMDRDSFMNDFDIGVFPTCKDWLSKNKEIYITIKKEDELVGYICFMPLKKSTYEKYKKGLLHDNQLSGKDILPYKSNHKYNCLFCSIVVKREYRSGYVLKLLFDGMKQKLLELKSRNIEIAKILADCVTERGVLLVSRIFSTLGFKSVCKHAGGEIYELDSNLLELLQL